MCGIVGIIQPEAKGAVNPEVLRGMNQSLVHRGPDDEGYYVDTSLGLAMRRLKIIDLEGGHQPLSNETGEIWTVFNGEIYNFRELRETLMGKGHQFRSRADTEVIVHLYEEEGEEFVKKLRGMFAIALWDRRARKLLLYRDRVGIKPLHYWFQGGTLLFASEIKALLEHPDVGRELSLSALRNYLAYLYIPAPETIYKEIHKLPPGHFLRYHEGHLEIQSYWDFSFPRGPQRSEEEWCEELRKALRESVRLHLVSDVPLGAFLSGGMDSSTVVSWMSQLSREPVKTYSIGFKDDRFNELPYARRVAKHYGTEHHEQIVEIDAFELLPKILSGFDEPFGDSSAIPTYCVSEFARKGVTVALSGDGGDELFGGYLWTQKEAWLEKYRALPSFLRRPIEKLLLRSEYHPLRERGLWSTVQRFVYDAGRGPVDSFSRRAMCFQPWMSERLLEPWVREEENHHDSGILESLYQRDQAASVIDKLLYLDSKVYLPDDLLTKVDRMSMLHSLEVRVPLLDHPLIELACSIPFSLKVKNRTTKYLLKKAMGDLLPREILRQRKQGFSIPLQRWFQSELYPFAKQTLLQEKALSRKFFRPEYVAWLLEEHRQGRQRFGSQLYALVIFELWSRLTKETKGKTYAGNVRLKDLVG